MPFTLQAEGRAANRLPSFEIRDNVGDLLLDGAPHLGVVYAVHYGFGGYDLYDVLSLAQDGSNLGVTWLYCVGDTIEWVWSVSYLQRLSADRAVGSCRGTRSALQTRVRLPALLALPQPQPTGFKIAGPNISLGDGIGAMRLGGETYDVHPFATVDCTSCPGGSWYEIHCLFRRRNEAGFGILYLYPSDPKTVGLYNALTLPTLQYMAASFDATWSGRPVAAVQGWFSPPGEPAVTLGRPLPPRYESAR